MDMNADLILRTLKELGEELERESAGGQRPIAPIRRVIAGGAAGLLAGALRASRVTMDCDVPWSPGDPEAIAVRERVRGAAERIAAQRGLSGEWLSFRCAMYAWKWAPGWDERCEPVAGEFGALRVFRLSRRDLIVAKVMGAAQRAQDRQDLEDLAPTREELDWVDKNLERVEAEDLGQVGFDDERGIVRDLRSVL